jgi:chromosome segregation ATPase
MEINLNFRFPQIDGVLHLGRIVMSLAEKIDTLKLEIAENTSATESIVQAIATVRAEVQALRDQLASAGDVPAALIALDEITATLDSNNAKAIAAAAVENTPAA